MIAKQIDKQQSFGLNGNDPFDPVELDETDRLRCRI
jgi:hypothetical protein